MAIQLVPAGRLSMVIKEGQPPQNLTVSFLHTVPDREAQRIDQPCEVEAKRVHCVVPAQRLDARIEAPGYAPLFFWDLEVSAQQTLDLGERELEAGASVTGWVEKIGGTDLGAEIVVWPRRAAEPRSREEIRRRSLVKQTTTTDERGHFVLSGLEPGPYRISARSEGFSSRSVDVEIDAEMSVELDETLTLTPKSELTMVLEPTRDPWGQPWQILLARETEEPNVFESVAKGAASNHGSWVSPSIDHGIHTISIVDSQGGTWRSETIALPGGPESLFWTVEVVPVRGSVTLGGEPLRAQVMFGTGTRAITFETDGDGSFEGSLPEEGSWPVRLRSGKTRLAADPVEVRRRAGKSYAEIELELPATVLEGKVTKNGRPVEALVVALRRDVDKPTEDRSPARRAAELSVWSDEKGAFEVLGLSPGHIELRASDRTAESDWATVLIEEDQAAQVDLVMTERLEIFGRVVQGDHPAAGAKIVVLPEGNVATSVATDASGGFSVKLQSHIRSATLVVMPMAGGMIALAPLVVLPEGNADVLIRLPTGSGRLFFEISAESPTRPVRSMADLVPDGTLYYNGAAVSLRQILAIFPPAGSFFEDGIPLPPVAEGWWKFCPAADRSPKSCQQFQINDGSSHLISASAGRI